MGKAQRNSAGFSGVLAHLVAVAMGDLGEDAVERRQLSLAVLPPIEWMRFEVAGPHTAHFDDAVSQACRDRLLRFRRGSLLFRRMRPLPRCSLLRHQYFVLSPIMTVADVFPTPATAQIVVPPDSIPGSKANAGSKPYPPDRSPRAALGRDS